MADVAAAPSAAPKRTRTQDPGGEAGATAGGSSVASALQLGEDVDEELGEDVDDELDYGPPLRVTSTQRKEPQEPTSRPKVSLLSLVSLCSHRYC